MPGSGSNLRGRVCASCAFDSVEMGTLSVCPTPYFVIHTIFIYFPGKKITCTGRLASNPTEARRGLVRPRYLIYFST